MTPGGNQDERWVRSRNRSAGAVQPWSCAPRSGVTCWTRAHWRSFGTKESRLLHSCEREGRKKVSGIVPEELDFKLFIKCLQSARQGTTRNGATRSTIGRCRLVVEAGVGAMHIQRSVWSDGGYTLMRQSPVV